MHKQDKNWVMCEHANENPNRTCRCPKECPCWVEMCNEKELRKPKRFIMGHHHHQDKRHVH